MLPAESAAIADPPRGRFLTDTEGLAPFDGNATVTSRIATSAALDRNGRSSPMTPILRTPRANGQGLYFLRVPGWEPSRWTGLFLFDPDRPFRAAKPRPYVPAEVDPFRPGGIHHNLT